MDSFSKQLNPNQLNPIQSAPDQMIMIIPMKIIMTILILIPQTTKLPIQEYNILCVPF